MREIATVVGAGHVGFPHAIYLCQFYDNVYLVDRDVSKINKLKEGKPPVNSADFHLNEATEKFIKSDVLKPAQDLIISNSIDVIFVAINYDFQVNKNNEENLTNLFDLIFANIGENALVVLESTVKVGTYEKLILPLIEKWESQRVKQINYVFSYERVTPGINYLNSIYAEGKVFSANNRIAEQLYIRHLNKISPAMQKTILPNIQSAEMAKLVENTYRLCNIALIRELTIIAESFNVDLSSCLNAVRSRETHNNIRYPGCSPGGYCLTKDPGLLLHSSEELAQKLPIISNSIRQAKAMTSDVVRFLEKHIAKADRVLLIGVAYLDGVGDLRESSALALIDFLSAHCSDFAVFDRYVNFNELENKFNVIDKKQITNFKTVILTNRNGFKPISDFAHFTKIFDVNSILTQEEKETLQKSDSKVIQYGDFK